MWVSAAAPSRHGIGETDEFTTTRVGSGLGYDLQAHLHLIGITQKRLSFRGRDFRLTAATVSLREMLA